MSGATSDQVQAIRVALILEYGQEVARLEVARAANLMPSQHHSIGRAEGIAWCLDVLAFLGPV